jgi:hypothetical protein
MITRERAMVLPLDDESSHTQRTGNRSALRAAGSRDGDFVGSVVLASVPS